MRDEVGKYYGFATADGEGDCLAEDSLSKSFEAGVDAGLLVGAESMGETDGTDM